MEPTVIMTNDQRKLKEKGILQYPTLPYFHAK